MQNVLEQCLSVFLVASPLPTQEGGLATAEEPHWPPELDPMTLTEASGRRGRGGESLTG